MKNSLILIFQTIFNSIITASFLTVIFKVFFGKFNLPYSNAINEILILLSGVYFVKQVIISRSQRALGIELINYKARPLLVEERLILDKIIAKYQPSISCPLNIYEIYISDLPDGGIYALGKEIIILSHEFIALIKSEDEMIERIFIALYLHEVGHLVHKHTALILSTHYLNKIYTLFYEHLETAFPLFILITTSITYGYFGIVVTSGKLFIDYLSNIRRLKFEFEADKFVRLHGFGQELKYYLQELPEIEYKNLIEKIYLRSHPTNSQRIKYLSI